jgi:hypothetical protein
MSNLDRIKEPLAAFVKGSIPQVDYFGQYPGRVMNQRGSNSFDFQPDDSRLPGMTGIPIKLPFPGFGLTLDLSASPRAVVAFANGDPSAPELHLWEFPGAAILTMDATTVRINTSGSPGPAAAREGDSVQVTFQPAEIAQITAPPSGGPCSGGPITITGQITSGSSKTEIG